MEKLKQSPAEILKQVEIQTIEQEELNRVFAFLISQDKTKAQIQEEKKRQEVMDKIGAMDIAKTLMFLGCRPSKAEVDLIIWVSQFLD